jgi:hypothetical protein
LAADAFEAPPKKVAKNVASFAEAGFTGAGDGVADLP